MKETHTPTAFLNRFEKAYLDINLLKTIGVGTNKMIWDARWDKIDKIIQGKFSDHYRMYRYRGLFAGCKRNNEIMSRITLLLSCSDEDANTFGQACYYKLLKAASLQYLIQDSKSIRVADGFVGYGNLIDLLQTEGITDRLNDIDHKLLRVVTFDTYKMKEDFDGNGMKVFQSLKQNEQKDVNNENANNENAINSHFVNLQNFHREKSFYDYILSFLDDNQTAVSTLVIQCDPIPNNSEKEATFIHYLHAQYLIEKAKTKSVKPNNLENMNEERNTAKNIVFLIYMTRSNPYPLLFNKNWQHLYCDALCRSDHPLFPEIQINDINISNADDRNRLLKRVNEHSGRIVKNIYVSALRKTEPPKDKDVNLDPELQRFRLLLEKPGKFYTTLIKRISKILADPETGAEKCISTAFNRKLENRGSFRSLVMMILGQKIESELVHVLSVIFSNGNSYLYKSGFDLGDNNDELLSKYWLELLSEPQIVRFKAKSYGTQNQNQQTPITNTIRAKYPFSVNIHAYFMSFKKQIISNMETYISEKRQENEHKTEETEIDSQRFILKELSQRLEDASMDFPITNLPDICVQQLLSDIVQLESITFGIKSGKKSKEIGKYSKEITESVSIFLWQISLKLHNEYLGIREKHKKQKEKQKKEPKPKPQVINNNDINGGIVGVINEPGTDTESSSSSDEPLGYDLSDDDDDGDDDVIKEEKKNDVEIQELNKPQENKQQE
eukprot:51421_1